MRGRGSERACAAWIGQIARIAHSTVLAAIASLLPACTDGRGASEPPASKPADAPARNSDGSLQVLPPGPPSRPPHAVVLAYDDFGPQVLAGELLGPEWWQWEAGGSWALDDRFDVRVVVYRGMTLAEAQAEYPTVEGRADYRHVSYDDAMAFLERALVETDGEPSLRRLHEELAATRAWVRQSLGAARPDPRP